jgi:hypothetical protein
MHFTNKITKINFNEMTSSLKKDSLLIKKQKIKKYIVAKINTKKNYKLLTNANCFVLESNIKRVIFFIPKSENENKTSHDLFCSL